MSATTTTLDVFQGTGKREKILRAAVDVFARRGYAAARVSEVAKAAGVADGTIYLYFEGKEELLTTIFHEQSRALLAALRSELEGLDSAEEKLRRAIEFHLQALGSDRSLAIVFQIELRHSLKFVGMVSREELAEYLELLKSLVEEGQHQGEFRGDLSPQVVANAIFGMVDEMMSSWVLSDRAEPPVNHAATIAALALGGLSTRSG